MFKLIYKFVIISFCLSFTGYLHAQLTDAGAIASLGFSKDFGRNWNTKLEQEFRFNNSFSNFERSSSSVIIDYTLLPKILKAGIEYDLIYLDQNTYYEFRHRTSAALSTQFKINNFEINIRSKFQSTWRNELRGDYNFNPKHVWRNKLECTYNIFGSPLKPIFSAESFCPTNGANGFYMDSYRLKLALKYKYSSHQSIEAFVRYDAEIQQSNPQKILYTGIGWSYKLK